MGKPLIFIVEDNEDVLYNLKMTLEFNEYEVITANDGTDALETLPKLKRTPDIILSDIMMPKMNGYDFFQAVSENIEWNRIPFIFLTARTSPDDIRFGKMLGVDDYLLKPFKEADLLATIAGKIARAKKIHNINKKLEQSLADLPEQKSLPREICIDESSIILIYMVWDDKHGPKLSKYYPRSATPPYSMDKIGFQLFNSVASIYGQDQIHEAQGILLNIQNIDEQGYIFFDSKVDSSARGMERPIMVGVIAPRITYFASLKIREVFRTITSIVKEEKSWEIKDYWQQIYDILC